MKKYYTEKYFLLTDYNQDFCKTERLKPNSIFRNFLIKENADNSSKYFRFKKKEILPKYTNIKRKMAHRMTEIKSYFDVKGTVFKEIKLKDAVVYSKFAKNMKDYFFGPQGLVTQTSPQLKKYYNLQEKNKIGLNTKIYAGRWEFFEDNYKTNRYLARLKSNRKKVLSIGGNFATEDDLNHKIHALYLQKKKIDEKAKIKEEKNKENIKKFLEKQKRRFSVNNDISQIKLFGKGIFEYTSISPNKIRDSGQKLHRMNSYNKSYQKRFSLLTNFNIFQEGRKKTINIINEMSKEKINDISTIEEKNKKYKKKLDSIKNVFKREKLENQFRQESKKHFKKLKSSINNKLNLIIDPSKNLLKSMHIIKRKNQTNYAYKNKGKYKEDIKIIVEDIKKDHKGNMNKFLKANLKRKIIDNKNSIPEKIHFSYFDKSKANIHDSIKELIKNITAQKEEEKERKYGKNIRTQFELNSKTIEQLAADLDSLKNKKKLK